MIEVATQTRDTNTENELGKTINCISLIFRATLHKEIMEKDC